MLSWVVVKLSSALQVAALRGEGSLIAKLSTKKSLLHRRYWSS